MLFLDVDGVLNCRTSWERYPRRHVHMIDDEKVDLLNEVVRRTGCLIVVSSTWRMGAFSGPKGCRAILRRRGLKARFPRDWRTPILRSFHQPDLVRGDEIADWLSRNGSPAYAIVDDDSDMLPEQLPRFVKTTFENGLTRAHADRLITLLATPIPSDALTTETGQGAPAGQGGGWR